MQRLAARERMKPTVSEAGEKERAERERRRAEALRENLLKRKAQQRARAGAASALGDPGKGRPAGDGG